MRTSWKGMLGLAATVVGVIGAIGCGDDGGAGGSAGTSTTTGTGGEGGEGGGSTSTGTGGQGGQGGQGGDGVHGGQGQGGQEPNWPGPFPISDRKLDVLFVIDNSRSMADKQSILALAIPDLLRRLTNPRCVDGSGGAVDAAAPGEPCPAGYDREFAPVSSMHVGVISSSLGGHGADACQASSPGTQSNNDRGRLLARSAPDQTDDLETYQGQGFLAWDPAMQLSPTGEVDFGSDTDADSNGTALVPALRNMVLGVGQIGCGYESQLESWYRFLVDPEPYGSISVLNGVATPQGIDSVLIQQRADFLRSSSTLAIIVLSDENDCSIREHGQYFYAAQQQNANGSPFHLPRARSECAVDPADPCCRSCGQAPGNCPVDPTCYVNGDPGQGIAPLNQIEDPPNLRCFEQKRRFGIDFLYPVDRYLAGLTSAVVTNRFGELVPNPIFSDLDPNDGDSTIRTPEQVFLAGLVGVPWQDLARDPADPAQGLKSAAELDQPVGGHASAWQVILGEPVNHVPPADPFMRESIGPRAGQNPITGDAITPPGGAPNAINGAERSIPEQDDLQYACIFELPPGLQRDCSAPGVPACECQDPGNDNPVCEGTTQVRAKAYPGLRELDLLHRLGGQGITTSLCAAQMGDGAAPDFGYRPAMRAIVDALAPAL